MTRTGLKSGTRPGARQPGGGLDGLLWADWMTDALCPRGSFKGEPITPELWFPTSCSYPLLARQVCEACPVRARCLQWALDNENGGCSRHGMFGGLTPDERAALAKETA